MSPKSFAGIFLSLAAVGMMAFGFWIGHLDQNGGWGLGGFIAGCVLAGSGYAILTDQ